MNIVDMNFIIQHSRLDDIRSGCAERALIELYAESAEETVLGYLNRTLEDIYETYGKIPSAIKHAVLILIDNSYEHRSPTTMQNLYRVDYSFDALLKQYMIL